MAHPFHYRKNLDTVLHYCEASRRLSANQTDSQRKRCATRGSRGHKSCSGPIGRASTACARQPRGKCGPESGRDTRIPIRPRGCRTPATLRCPSPRGVFHIDAQGRALTRYKVSDRRRRLGAATEVESTFRIPLRSQITKFRLGLRFLQLRSSVTDFARIFDMPLFVQCPKV